MLRFCFKCGSLANESNKCQNTSCFQCEKNVGGTYLDQRLEGGILRDREYYEKQASSTVHCTQYYACHSCQYLMWHQLNWCPKCGGKFVQLNTTYREMKDKYGNYRIGY